MAGTLFVVATPLGNLGDWPPRARDVVAAADLVLVEDTRVSRKLFNAFELHPSVRVLEKHRERRETGRILEELQSGRDIALLSDAGTPGIADPGALLVSAALDAGVAVVAVPGPSILAAALSVSGVDTLPILFHGYPPAKSSEQRTLLQDMLGDTRTAHILLLPPHDAATFLDLIDEWIPARRLVLCRELTKRHESVISGTASQIHSALSQAEAFRGEMTLVIHAATEHVGDQETSDLLAEARRLRQEYGLWGRDLSDFLAFKANVPRRTAYRIVEDLKAED